MENNKDGVMKKYIGIKGMMHQLMQLMLNSGQKQNR